jgi:hypothetical protein
MAGKSATLTVKIVSDAKNAAAGFDEASSRVDRFKSGLDKASVAAGGALLGIGALAKGAFDAASNLQQNAGAVEAVFGDMSDAVKAISRDAASEFGLSASSFDQSASLIGAQLQNMGLNASQAWDQTYDLIGLGSDLAAQYGGTTADAIDAVSSALKGERDPIERYAVSLTQASIDAQIAAMGLDTHTDAAKRNATMQATLAIITNQTATAHGAFAREADTAAGAQQRATAAWENAQAELGTVLLPVVAAAAAKVAEFSAFLVANKDTVLPLIAVVAGLAAAVFVVNGAMAAYRAVAAVATAAQWLFNIALDANPIGLVVIAIAALVAAVVLAYNKFAWFRDIVKSIWEWLKKAWDFAGKVGSAIGNFFSAPAAVTADTAGAGLFGAAAGPDQEPIRGASLGSLPGGTSPSAGQGSGPAGTVVNVNVTGQIVDPIDLGRTLTRVLNDYAATTGRRLTVSLGAT